MSPFKKDPLWFLNGIFDCNLWILWEVIISYNKLMQLVSQEISASWSSMSVIHSKEWASRPIINCLEFRLNDVENDWNPVFIIIPHNALMGIGSIATYNSVLLAGKLCRVIWLNESINLLLFHLHVLLLLLHSHDETSVCYQFVLALRLAHTSIGARVGTSFSCNNGSLFNLLMASCCRRLRFAWILLLTLTPRWSKSMPSTNLSLRLIGTMVTICSTRGLVSHSWTCS